MICCRLLWYVVSARQKIKCHWCILASSLFIVSDLWKFGRGLICNSCKAAKLLSDFGLGRLAVSMCRLRPSSDISDLLPTDSTEVLACSACSDRAFTTALMVFDSDPISSSSSSSSWCDTKFGFLPILFNLKKINNNLYKVLNLETRKLLTPRQIGNEFNINVIGLYYA